MKELIARLEAATEGSRDLDFEIWKLHAPTEFFGQKIVAISWSHGDVNIETADGFMHFDTHDVPLFTKSIDAALTLVPEDPANPGKPMLWSIAYDEDGVGGERSCCAGLGKGYHDPEFIYGHSAAPALALCIAALKARA